MKSLKSLSIVLSSIFFALIVANCFGVAFGEVSPKQRLKEAQVAFDKADFSKTLELVEPLIKNSKFFKQASRLKMLSLVHLRRTPEGVDVYNELVKALGQKEDEALLREVAIQSILPLRASFPTNRTVREVRTNL